MNLARLFETQKALDDHIMDEHPDLKDKDNLDWKILALQVELGECANEWRGFKKWSNDQEPRKEKILNLGYKIVYKNPLLEEYVDCLHFILSIGLELQILRTLRKLPSIHQTLIKEKSIIKQFKEILRCALRIDLLIEMDISSTDHVYKNLLDYYFGLGEMLGFTWEQIEKAYFDKNKINHQRQEEGY